MQRLTKYALLLKAILKKTEDDEQQDLLKAMVRILWLILSKYSGTSM